MENCNLENILAIYELEISKNVKNKKKLFLFERNKMQNVCSVIRTIKSKNYQGGRYNIFLVKEPKFRIIMALKIKDKVINHFITRYVLEKKLSKFLDARNVATRKGMGTSYGIALFKKYLEKNKKHGKFYILKIDIKKYFYSIDHEILKGMLKDKLDPDEYDFIESIIDSTNCEYINEKINKIKAVYSKKYPQNREEINSIPYYNYGKGLPIGNMTSQFLSIYYLNSLDHYIVHDLHLKYYVRYMDDFVIIDNDKEKLKDALIKIEKMLKDNFKLEINAKKTKIINSNEWCLFLGYKFKISNKKTIVKIANSSIDKIKKRIKYIYYLYDNKKICFNSAFSSIMCYWHSYTYGNQLKVRRIIDNCWFDKFYEK